MVCGAPSRRSSSAARACSSGLFLDPATHAARIAIEGLPWFALGFICFIVNLTAIGYYQSLERVGVASGSHSCAGSSFSFELPLHARLCGTGGHLAGHAVVGAADRAGHSRRQPLAASADRLIGSVRLRTKRDAAVSSIPFRSFRRHQTVMISAPLRSSAAIERFGELLQQFLYLRFAVFRLVFGHSLLLRLLEGFDRMRRALRELTRAVSASLPDLFHEVAALIDRQRIDRICSPLFEGVGDRGSSDRNAIV